LSGTFSLSIHLPWAGRPTDQHPPAPLLVDSHPVMPPACAQCWRCAGNYARHVPPERGGVVCLREEVMSRYTVRLASLDDRLNACSLVSFEIPRCDPFGRTVDHHMDITNLDFSAGRRQEGPHPSLRTPSPTGMRIKGCPIQHGLDSIVADDVAMPISPYTVACERHPEHACQ
jgi:hypothetical protein